MADKFMKLKKIVLPIISSVLMVSSMTGCAVADSSEMLDMINNGQEIVIEVAQPKYENTNLAEEGVIDWIQLDQLTTYNNGFRQSYDELFNINIVTESGKNGKSGCLFVDENGNRDGNATLADAFRNRAFVTKYWHNEDVQSRLVELANEAYTDLDSNVGYSIAGALNAYYNLMPSSVDNNKFNPTKTVTREDFYSLVFKATNEVQDIKEDKAFSNAIGGKTENSKYAQETQEHAFLNTNTGGLYGLAYGGQISRAEAIYMIVNMYFPEELAKVDGSEKAFNDTLNGGDIALDLGFKEKDKEGNITAKPMWEAYTLNYMCQNPDEGLQEELYKAMVVAKDLKLITSSSSRWDEAIVKYEAITLIVNAELAKNELYGYASTEEYGKMEEGSIVDEEVSVDVETDAVTADPDKVLESGYTLGEVNKMINENMDIRAEHGNIEDVKGMLDDVAFGYGTTLDELNRLPDYCKPPIFSMDRWENGEEVEIDTGGNESGSGGETSTGETGSSSGNSNSGSSNSGSGLNEYGILPHLDKNNNGIMDELESSYAGGKGTTESVGSSGLNSN